MVDAEFFGHRLDLEAGGRRGDGHGVALALVGFDEAPGVVEERLGDALDQQPLPELEQVVLGTAGPAAHTHLGQGDELGLGHRLALQGGPHGAGGFFRPDLEVPQTMLVEGHDRVALDDGAVEVEEGADLGAGGPVADLVERGGDLAHDADSVGDSGGGW